MDAQDPFRQKCNPEKLYGMPPSDKISAVGPASLAECLCWSQEKLSLLPPPEDVVLHPRSSVQPPTGWWFPQAKDFALNANPDPRFRRQYFYSSSYHREAEGSQLLENMKCVTSPPETVEVSWEAGEASFKPIPGQIELIPGIPFVELLNGNLLETITIACVHTLESISQYPEAEEVHNLIQRLEVFTWGESPDIPPIYRFEGLHHNMRSSGSDSSSSVEGSYSLASTLMEGNGHGILRPAKQASSPQASAHIGSILDILSQIWKLVMPMCLSKEEWHTIQFLFNDNNVFSFRSLEPGPVACQLNISALSAGGALEVAIGTAQGSWHVDCHDDPLVPTLFVLLLRLPPGSDPGAFCLGRVGLYTRIKDVTAIILQFRGNDIHSGFAPHILPTLEKPYNLAGEPNRAGYVLYCQAAATQRLADVGIHSTVARARDNSYQNYSEHGQTVLGTSYHGRLAREISMQTWNKLTSIGISPPLGPSMLAACTYHSHSGNVSTVDLPFHLFVDQDWIQTSRARYTWWRRIINDYHISMRKAWLQKNCKTPSSLPQSNAPTQTRAIALTTQRQPIPRIIGVQPDRQPDDNTQQNVGVKRVHNHLDADNAQSESIKSSNFPRKRLRKSCKGGSKGTRASQDLVQDRSDGMEEPNKDSEDQEYEIESIEDSIALEDGTILYRVKWKGYLDTESEYLREEDLQHCLELLNDFHTRQSDLASGSKSAEDKNVLALNEKGQTISNLKNLLSHTSIAMEKDKILDAIGRQAKERLSSPSFGRSLEVLESQAQLLPTIAQDDDMEPWSDEMVVKAFQQTKETASGFKTLFSDADSADILSFLTNWELGRSFITLFNWFTYTWPVMVSILLNCLRYQGKDSLLKMSPMFGWLVIHIFDYAKAGIDQSHQNCTNFCPLCTLSADDLAALPLFNPTSFPIRLPPVNSKYLQKDVNSHYAGCREVLTKFFYTYCFQDKMKAIDAFLNNKDRIKDLSDDAILGRFICRAAILAVIVEAFNGDDGILASHNWRCLLESPASIFAGHITAASISKRILEDHQSALAKLRIWFKGNVTEKSIEAAEQMANTIHDYAIKRFQHNAHPRHNPIPHPQQALRLQAVDRTPPEPSTLIPNQLHLSIPALLIRDAINTKRGLPSQEPAIQRIRMGLDPFSGQVPIKNFNPDNFDILRSANHYATLFSSIFTGTKLTTGDGISSMLAYMACGHGFRTRRFVTKHAPSLIFQGVEQCVSLYNLDNGVYGPCSDPMLWGQYCSQFCLTPSKNVPSLTGMENKFSPFFDKSLQKTWVELLGDLAGQDPKSSQNRKVSWLKALDWLQSRKLLGFKSGLTPLQLLNNLVFSEVVESPSVVEMAEWIDKNQMLGAYNGLKTLGYALDGKGPTWTAAAFIHLYEHLNQNLTDQDKEILHFSPIFLEHLLCKVQRFQKALKSSLLSIADAAMIGNQPFCSGTNLSNPRLSPIPLEVNSRHISDVIQKVSS